MKATVSSETSVPLPSYTASHFLINVFSKYFQFLLFCYLLGLLGCTLIIMILILPLVDFKNFVTNLKE
jgi:hypothetical protein